MPILSVRRTVSLGKVFLYQSVCGMGSRIVPVFCHRKRNLTSPFPDYRDHEVVEGGAKVMNGIPDKERNLGWRRCDGRDLDNLCCDPVSHPAEVRALG